MKLFLVELRDSIHFQRHKSSLKVVVKDLWRKSPRQKKSNNWDTQDIRKKMITYLWSVKRFRNDEHKVNHRLMNQLTVNVFPSQREIDFLYMLVARKGSTQPFKDVESYWETIMTMVIKKYSLSVLHNNCFLNLESRSLLVVYNASYHHEQGPLHKTKKQDMNDWLLKYDIPFANDIFVPEIYQLMELRKPRLNAIS